jgi:hypothetical protein
MITTGSVSLPLHNPNAMSPIEMKKQTNGSRSARRFIAPPRLERLFAYDYYITGLQAGQTCAVGAERSSRCTKGSLFDESGSSCYDYAGHG